MMWTTCDSVAKATYAPAAAQPRPMDRAHSRGCRQLLMMVSFLALVSASCSSQPAGPTLADLRGESILSARITGLGDGRFTDERAGPSPMVTQLRAVTGSWEAGSVSLAQAVQEHGWGVELINCVGTGNDVIAKKQIEGQWVLLESGTGTRGAGLILRIDPVQQPPEPLAVEGRCPPSLVAAAS